MSFKKYPISDEDRKKRRDTDSVESNDIGTGDKKSVYQIGLYNEVFWLREGRKDTCNCYSFACNISVDKFTADPGYGYRDNNEFLNSLLDLEEGIKQDGLVKILDGNPVEQVIGTIDKPSWKVAAFYWADDEHRLGYHFFREITQELNIAPHTFFMSRWAHKFHKNQPTSKKHNGVGYITNPEDEIKSLPINYARGQAPSLLGYYLVKPDAYICTPG
ncbi:hypothetical protein [Castellaniella sp.]|uniref:hypothetical protein n=1 Tax=Castellaniella sp. TaxID=1955812 RepID=UPI002AFE9925|nr:hypothetical protein [Castellaniella sp.]